MPVNPPPRISPRHIRGLHIIREETLRPFLGHYIYCRLKNRRSYWLCPQSVNAVYLSGYVWRRGGWRPSMLRISMIDTFY